MPVEDRAHPLHEPLAAGRDRIERIGLLENAETGLRRGERDRMGGVGPAMRHPAPEPAHHLLVPRHRCYRIAIRHRLGEGAEIGGDAIKLLDAAARHPEA